MIKYTGIILICSSVIFTGFLLCDRQKCAASILQEILELLKEITRQIKYKKSELLSVYSGFSSKMLSERGFLDDLKNGYDIKKSVNQKLYELSNTQKQHIISFFEKLGKSCQSKNEVELCNLYLDIFKELNDKAQKDYKTTGTLYKKLSIIFALMLMIILI